MRIIVLSLLLSCFSILKAQHYKDSLQALRVVYSGEILDTSAKVLNQQEINELVGLKFFDIDSTYRIVGYFEKKIGKKFEMPTSTDRKPIYRAYGLVTFDLAGKTHQLTIYQNMSLKKQKEYRTYLFLPLRDGSSGNETYGGGRYLDLNIPEKDTIILDFNRLYNPYCVYSHRYSCPIPPKENFISLPINAGEKVPIGHINH
jgi:uncharacterized protein (DUF1684 family)